MRLTVQNDLQFGRDLWRQALRLQAQRLAPQVPAELKIILDR